MLIYVTFLLKSISLKSTLHTLILLSLTILLGWNCEKSETEEINVYQGKEYFPLEIGKYLEYEMDSIIFDTTAVGVIIDTVELLVREEITETFEDLLGRTNYRVERSERSTTSDPWVIKSIYAALITENQAQRVEDNFRFVKMIFPLRDGEIWDGNQFIDPQTIITVAGETVEMYKDWQYEVEDVHRIDLFNAMPFDSVTTVYQANSENLIEYRFSMEKYATGVGLIYREMWILDTQCISDCLGQSWEEKAQKGFIIRQTITSHN